MNKSILSKIANNLKNGTLLKRGSVALKNRFIKYFRFNNLLIFLDPYRLINKRILKKYPVLNSFHKPYGNYYLDSRKMLKSNSVIYSLGVGTHIDFDIDLSKSFGCKVHMYDPTPVSIDFMKLNTLPELLFHPYGVWNGPSELKFYTPYWGGSSAVFPQFEGQKPDFVAQCNSLSVFMAENGHEHIDVLKMDIEGAGIVVMKDILKRLILPEQIIAEFERPIDKDPVIQIVFFSEILAILDELHNNGYEIFRIPQTGYKYFSFEFLCVKQ